MIFTLHIIIMKIHFRTHYSFDLWLKRSWNIKFVIDLIRWYIVTLVYDTLTPIICYSHHACVASERQLMQIRVKTSESSLFCLLSTAYKSLSSISCVSLAGDHRHLCIYGFQVAYLGECQKTQTLFMSTDYNGDWLKPEFCTFPDKPTGLQPYCLVPGCKSSRSHREFDYSSNKQLRDSSHWNCKLAS